MTMRQILRYQHRKHPLQTPGSRLMLHASTASLSKRHGERHAGRPLRGAGPRHDAACSAVWLRAIPEQLLRRQPAARRELPALEEQGVHARRAVVCHAEDQDPIGVRHHGRAQQSAARLRARRHDARPAASLVAPEEGKRPLDGGGLIAAHEIEEVRVVVGGVVARQRTREAAGRRPPPAARRARRAARPLGAPTARRRSARSIGGIAPPEVPTLGSRLPRKGSRRAHIASGSDGTAPSTAAAPSGLRHRAGAPPGCCARSYQRSPMAMTNCPRPRACGPA
eukprot:scaffold51278_cov58-Phaeocystis_antarctica.AAC.2